jgi:hypothetical protein
MEAEDFVHLTDGFKDSPALPEPGYVDRMLRFASAQSSKRASELQELSFELGTDIRLGAEELNDPGSWQTDTETLLAGQAQLIEWLEIVRRGSNSEFDRLTSVLCRSAERIAIRPEFNLKQGAIERGFRYFPTDLQAAAAYALLLLLNDTRGRERLCRCKYSNCQCYFLELKATTGRPRRAYCSHEHFQAARKQGAAKRIREYRRKKRLESKPRTRRIQR